MGQNTEIAWTDHSFNPWIGCQAVSTACDRCYAEKWVERFGGDFSQRRRTSAANWRQPIKWDRDAAAAGFRRRVFCASLADVFDNRVDPEWRADLWKLIRATPNLDWLVLTKRPQNWLAMLPSLHPETLPNMRLGVTIENQVEADRRGIFLQVLANTGFETFVSYEPVVGPVDWSPFFGGSAIGWMIAGAESGTGARWMDPGILRSLRDACELAGVPFFVKQLSGRGGRAIRNIDQFPEDLRIRQFPQ